MKGKKTKTNKQQSKIIKKGKNKTKRTRSKKVGGATKDNNIFGKINGAIISNGATNGQTNLDYAQELQNEMNKSQHQKKANYQYNNETEENGWTPPAIATNGPPEPKAMGGAGGPILVIGLLGGLAAFLAYQ